MSTHSGYPFARDLARGLRDAAHWIWERRETAKYSGFPFGEETISETVLMDLGSIVPRTIHIVPFNKYQEGMVGADWEWCLYDRPRSRYLRFLVQAKLLDKNDQYYSHIDRYIGDTGIRHIDRLAETSRNRNVTAVYAFYNHISDLGRVPIDACECHSCHKCWGASVAPLSAVKDLLPDKSFDSLKNVSFPWLCLLCSGRGTHASGDKIANAIAGLRRLDERSRRERHARGLDLPRPPDKADRAPPDYLEIALAGALEDVGSDLLRDVMRAQNPGLDGVVLVDASSRSRE